MVLAAGETEVGGFTLKLELITGETPDEVADTSGDSDLLLATDGDVRLLAAMDGDEYCSGPLGINELEAARMLLDASADDELTASELGIERVTGKIVDSTEVVGGGGVKLVAWSVDNRGVEYIPEMDVSTAIGGDEEGIPPAELDSEGALP